MSRARRCTALCAVMGALALALVGCAPAGQRGEAGTSGSAVRDEVSRDPESRAAAAALEGSLFELGFALTDQDGHEAHLADLRGRPFVASMIYTNCKSVCPRVTADLKRLEEALPSRDRDRVRFVLFSLDPERDSPEALRDFAARHALDASRWTLFATSPDDMRTLAAVLGVRHRPDAGGEIAHSAVIAVVDGEGVVRHRQVGFEEETGPLVSAVRALR